MARRELVVTLHAGEPKPADGELCPACLLPASVTVPIHTMCSHGITQVTAWTGCTTEDCREGIR